ncbi:MAG: hypothetical protein ACK5LP_05810 [Campylobacteraceae bacterium]
MQETYILTSNIISYSSMIFIVCALFGVAIFLFTSDMVQLKKRYKLLMPMYYMFFSIICFCGFILLTFKHFTFSLTNFVMLIVWLIILATSIKSYKLYKNSTLSLKFQQFTLIKYVSDILLVFLVFTCIKYLGL